MICIYCLVYVEGVGFCSVNTLSREAIVCMCLDYVKKVG